MQQSVWEYSVRLLVQCRSDNMALYRPKIKGKFASKSWFTSRSLAVDFVNMTRGYNVEGLEIVTSESKVARKGFKKIWE